MTSALQAWHEACNLRTAALEKRRLQQFGLRPINHDSADGAALPGEIWAWQHFGRNALAMDAQAISVRVGFAGRRVHLGHLGLARAAAQLAEPAGRVVVFDGALGGSLAEEFISALHHYASSGQLDVRLVRGGLALRATQERALDGLRLNRLRRLYGWDDATPASALSDVAAMLGFFLYDVDDSAGESLALVDAMQAPHSALLVRAARIVGTPAPTLLYRRLFPSLNRPSNRASARDPSSVIFADDPEPVIRRKFLRAITGGRADLESQRVMGGEPTRCSAFAVIELTCPPQQAEDTLGKCVTGAASCSSCKSANVDCVVAGIQAAKVAPLRASHAPAVSNAVIAALEHLHTLPPRDAAEIEMLIAGRSGVDVSEVVVGHGSTEVMDWLFVLQSRKLPGGRVIATEPTFELYGELAERHGLNYTSIAWDSEGFSHDIPTLMDSITSDIALCILDVPHTVSGTTAVTADQIAQLARALPEQALLVLDAVYSDFDRSSILGPGALVRSNERVVACGSMSKAYCLLGARVGYVLAPLHVADALRAQRLPYSMDSLALAAAQAALRDEVALRRTIAASHAARDLLTAALGRLGVSYIPTEANFLLIHLDALFEPVARRMTERGTKFRDGRRWGQPGWMQVHLIDTPYVAPVIEALEQAVMHDNGVKLSSLL